MANGPCIYNWRSEYLIGWQSHKSHWLKFVTTHYRNIFPQLQYGGVTDFDRPISNQCLNSFTLYNYFLNLNCLISNQQLQLTTV
jgi:hypothetical protein